MGEQLRRNRKPQILSPIHILHIPILLLRHDARNLPIRRMHRTHGKTSTLPRPTNQPPISHWINGGIGLVWDVYLLYGD